MNEPRKCYSILKWDGTPTNDEGVISRDCPFLQIDDPTRVLFDTAAGNPFTSTAIEPRRKP